MCIKNPHHFDAGPDADPDSTCGSRFWILFDADPDFYVITLACHLQTDADPDPAYHFDADPDPNPTFQFDAGSGSTTLLWLWQNYLL